jgi:hypothetical protein
MDWDQLHPNAMEKDLLSEKIRNLADSIETGCN